MNIIQLYDDYEKNGSVFSMSTDELKSLIIPLVYNKLEVEKKNGKVPQGFPQAFDRYIGIRPAGHFFAYDHPVVWIYLSNNHTDASVSMRHYQRGFSVTITTVDDAALYTDWAEPLSNEILEKVLDYFNILCIDGLDTAQRTYDDLVSIIGVPGECSFC